jgi:uncharacterized membrane protein
MKESHKKVVSISAALAGAIALTLASGVGAVPEQPQAWEKCAGISLTGHNDCGSTDGRHTCAGLATKDNDPTEWIYLPEGACAKIKGGKVVGKKPAKAAAAEKAEVVPAAAE